MSRHPPLSIQYIQRAISNPLLSQTCQQLHGGRCLLRAFKYLGTGMDRFARLYFLYLFGLFLVIRRKKVLKNPQKQITSFMKAFVRSLLYGGTYLGVALYIMCLTSRVFGNNGYLINTCAGTFGGVALMIENPSRQPEVALYIFTQALKALYNMGERRNILLNVPQGMSLLYACSMAVVCYHYFNNKEALRRTYLNLIDRILGDS